jgi:tyrosine-protein phosphatase YwqE
VFGFFRKKSTQLLGLSGIGVDMHSHLIPGIDDGAKTVEDSITLIRGLQDLGYQKIITTPHIYKEHYPNTKEEILRGLNELRIALKIAKIDIPIEASAEYFMDEHFEDLLERNEILPLSNKYVLVEMSFFGMPPKLEQYIFKIQLKGYIPILAHPERYLFYHNDYEQFEELKAKGVLLQLNILSILGYYGKPIKLIAHKLLKDKLIDLIGTDMHHVGHLEYLKSNLKNNELQQILSKYEFQNANIFGT